MFWVRLRIPESPRFLAATGRVDEAEAILGQVARENGVPERDVPRIVPPADASDKVEIKRLFEGQLARTTVMLWSTWFFIALAYYGLFSWLPKIFAERGFDVVQTYGYTLLLAAAQLPGYFSAAWLVERWGRKRTFVTYLSIAALCTFVYGAATSLTVLIAAARAHELLRARRVVEPVRLHARAAADAHAHHRHGRGERHGPRGGRARAAASAAC